MGETVRIYGHKIELPEIDELVTNVMVIVRFKNPNNMKEGNVFWELDEVSDAVDATGMIHSVSVSIDQGWYQHGEE